MIELGLTFEQLPPKDQKALEKQYQDIPKNEPGEDLITFGRILLEHGFTRVGVVFELQKRATEEGERQTDDTRRRIYEKAAVRYGGQLRNTTLYNETPDFEYTPRDPSKMRDLYVDMGRRRSPDGGGSGGRPLRNTKDLKNR